MKAGKQEQRCVRFSLVEDVTDEDAFIMSLAENIARRGYRPLEILADIEILRKRGYSA